MTDTLIVEASGFLVALVAVVAPIVRLNSNIATLNATLAEMRKDYESHDRRIEKHGEQIDELSTTVANHGARIEVLEHRKDL